MMNPTATLWFSDSENDWQDALNRYWSYVRPENMELEKSLNRLDLAEIEQLDEQGWYSFLHDRYFKWKFTAPNRYATTTMHLDKYVASDSLDVLHNIKYRLLSLNVGEIRTALSTAKEIKGLGIAGASGLLALMYPQAFATVDQFAVKALREISQLPESEQINRINENNIKLGEGVLLIQVMRRKSDELKQKFSSDFWTPRMIDMVLWGAR